MTSKRKQAVATEEENDVEIRFRLPRRIKNKIRRRAALLCNGNVSELLRYAGVNCSLPKPKE